MCFCWSDERQRDFLKNLISLLISRDNLGKFELIDQSAMGWHFGCGVLLLQEVKLLFHQA